jgi:hypothetical protein
MLRDDGALLLPEIYRGWCNSPHRHRPAIVDPSVDRFAILDPAEGGRYAIDARLHPQQQALRFRSNRDDTEGTVLWSVDGKPLSGSEWPLTPGTHMVEARISDGGAGSEEDSVTIEVGLAVEPVAP